MAVDTSSRNKPSSDQPHICCIGGSDVLSIIRDERSLAIPLPAHDPSRSHRADFCLEIQQFLLKYAHLSTIENA